MSIGEQYRGKFVVIEGLDGSGSTTQAEILASRLRREAHKFDISNVLRTREPSDGPGGLVIRLGLARRLELDERARTLLFAADRVDHVFNSKGLLSFLRDRGSVAVCERYLLSFLAYQSFDAKVDLDWLLSLSSQVIWPNLTIWIDVPAEECLRRIVANRGFHQELYETQGQLESIARHFREAVEKLKNAGFAVQRVDGEGTLRQVADRIRIIVENMLLPGHAPRSDWGRLFKRNQVVARYITELEKDGLGVEIREIQSGIQVRVFSGPDVVHVNIYHRGTVNTQGTVTPTKARAEQIMRKVLADQAQSVLFTDSEGKH